MGFLLILLLASNLFATEYFVAPNGDDSNSGTESAPFASIQHGISQLSPGDILSIVSGTYAPASKPIIWEGGTAEEPILIRGVGEVPPVIDGSNYNDDWPHGFEISGPYVRLENIHVQNAKYVGISVWNTHNVTLSRCKVSGSEETGIGIQSETLGGTRDVVVEECEVFNNVLMNTERTMNGGWGSGIGAGHCNNIIFRNNHVYENYGEGLLTYLSDSVTMTGNVSRDNFSVSLYVDNGTNVVIQNNFAYSTGKSDFYRDNIPASGFQIANETDSINPSRNVTVQNNLFVNQRSALYYGNYGAGGGLKEFRYRYNTAWNSLDESVHIDNDEHEDVIIEGNIFVQSGNLPYLFDNGSSELITARNNLWFGGTDPYLDGEGNVYEDPLLPGGGAFDPAGYVPPIQSPAAENGGNAEGVTVDFFGNTRSAPFDIGAFANAETINLKESFTPDKFSDIQIRHTSKNIYLTPPALMSYPVTVTLTNLQGRILSRIIAEKSPIIIPRTGAGTVAILTLSNSMAQSSHFYRILVN